MDTEALHRFRIAYAKLSAVRFTGHLDMQRTWERTLRRARVPLAYSRGFTPRPRMQMSPALPLGCTSECELIDVWLKEPLEADDLLAALQAAAPPGLRVDDVQAVPADAPALQNEVVASEYCISFFRGEEPDDLETQVAALLAAEALPRERREKRYDLRPLIEELTLQAGPEGPTLRARLATRPGATGRPDELLQAMGIDPAVARIHRTRLIFRPSGDRSG